ncbi:hypothetical protein D3C84_1204060 [compost metagenome]
MSMVSSKKAAGENKPCCTVKRASPVRGTIGSIQIVEKVPVFAEMYSPSVDPAG